jgi:hypothetical protein
LKDLYAKYQWLGFEILGLDSETLGRSHGCRLGEKLPQRLT